MNFANASNTDSPPLKSAPTMAGDEAFDVSGSKNFSFAIFICWIVAFLSIAGSIFFWLLNNSAKQAIATKSEEKQQIINEISSPSLSDIEVKATSFKSAVNQLSQVNKTRYSMDTFLTKFYTKVAQNVKITNIAVTSDGAISVSGTTVSYRAVADQMVLLKEWKVNSANILKDVKLASVTESVNESLGNAEVTFLFSAVIDKNQSLVEVVKPATTATTDVTVGDATGESADSALSENTDATTSTTDTTSDITSEGGTNASIQ